jgi:hypothetical protein
MSSTDAIMRRIALVDEMRSKWRGIALSTRPLDFHCAEQAIYRAYDCAGYCFPDTVEFVESPRQGAKRVETLGETLATEMLRSDVSERRYGIRTGDRAALGITGLFSDLEQMGQHLCRLLNQELLPLMQRQQHSWHWRPPAYCPGPFDAGRLCYEDYKAASARGSSYGFRGQMEAAQECGLWWPYDDVCIVSAKPTHLSLDSSSRLHSTRGPAMLFSDGFKLYALHGILMPKNYIENLDKMTARFIEKVNNVEQRRALMEYYGEENYLMESGAKLVHQDDFGTLYRKKEPDEPLVMVKVVNSTPEPDGTYKDYFLRVPPTVRTAREAVAWTFGLENEEYAPLIET